MNYTFNNIVGYEKEKVELAKLCDILNNREKYLAKGGKLPKGVCFYGPTGTGKTLFARVLANSCNLPLEIIDLVQTSSRYSVSRQLQRAFKKANGCDRPTIVFIDEIDKLLPSTDSSYQTDKQKLLLAQLLTLIDGINGANVFFVVSCNDYEELPSSFVRAGRIDKKFYLGKPDYESRVALADYYISLSKCTFEMPLSEMAKLTSGYSCAEVETLINECICVSDDDNHVTSQQFRQKDCEIRQSNSAHVDVIDAIDACRDVGHLLVARTFVDENFELNSNVYTTSAYFDDICGRDSDDEEDDEDYEEDDEDYEEDDETAQSKKSAKNYSFDEYRQAITVLMGGVVAEEMLFGHSYDNCDYVFSDTDNMLLRCAKNGLLGLQNVFIVSRHEDYMPYADEKIAKLNALFESIAVDCHNQACDILKGKKQLIEKLMRSYVERTYLKKMQIDEIIAENESITNNG